MLVLGFTITASPVTTYAITAAITKTVPITMSSTGTVTVTVTAVAVLIITVMTMEKAACARKARVTHLDCTVGREIALLVLIKHIVIAVVLFIVVFSVMVCVVCKERACVFAAK